MSNKVADKNKKIYRHIKSLLILHDIMLKDIANTLGVKRSSVTLVVQGKRKSKRIRQAVADVLNMDINRLWPSKRKAKP